MLHIDLGAFAIAARWEKLPNLVSDAQIGSTATDPQFPGTVLPVVEDDGTIVWYALAQSSADWRTLQPLLNAFVGPTVTDFSGRPTELRDEKAFEHFLVKEKVAVAARIAPGRGCEELTVRAFERLRSSLHLRPSPVLVGKESTARILGRIDMCLAVGDRDGANRWFSTLKSEFRLDTLNLLYLQVRILGHFRCWHEMVSSEWFDRLCFTQKPSIAAEIMLEALWHVRLAQVADDLEALGSAYKSAVRHLARPLLSQATDSLSALVQRISALDGAEHHAAATAGAVAQELLERAVDAPSPARVADAIKAVIGLNDEDRDTLRDSATGGEDLQKVGPLSNPTPTDWDHWLSSLADSEFVSYTAYARDGATLWPISEMTSGEWANTFGERLLAVGLGDGIAASRLVESVPALVTWVKADPLYPQRPLVDVYEALLQLLGLTEYRGAAEREAALDLLDAILALGPNQARYKRQLTDFDAFFESEAGVSSAYWLIDVAATLLNHPAPDANARLAALNRILASLQPIVRALTAGQRVAYDIVAGSASWPTLKDLPAIREGSHGIPQRLSIAIYTLTESAGRQAEAALLGLEPTIKVSLAHDHVASSRLVRLARDADLFVMAASSATHAASDCILANRGNRALAYAAGRGFSSLVRAVEDYDFERFGLAPLR